MEGLLATSQRDCNVCGSRRTMRVGRFGCYFKCQQCPAATSRLQVHNILKERRDVLLGGAPSRDDEPRLISIPCAAIVASEASDDGSTPRRLRHCLHHVNRIVLEVVTLQVMVLQHALATTGTEASLWLPQYNEKHDDPRGITLVVRVTAVAGANGHVADPQETSGEGAAFLGMLLSTLPLCTEQDGVLLHASMLVVENDHDDTLPVATNGSEDPNAFFVPFSHYAELLSQLDTALSTSHHAGSNTMDVTATPGAFHLGDGFTPEGNHRIPGDSSIAGWCIDAVPTPTLEFWQSRATTQPLPPSTSEYDDRIATAFSNIPRKLREALHPFQREGVQFAIARNGRALIADEMGTGKTMQGLATVAAMNAFPLLIICPASVRQMWVDQLEMWLPGKLQPSDIRVIYGRGDRLEARERAFNQDAGQHRQGEQAAENETKGMERDASFLDEKDVSSGRVKCVVMSYHMAAALHSDWCGTNTDPVWKGLIVDESHVLHTNTALDRIVGADTPGDGDGADPEDSPTLSTPTPTATATTNKDAVYTQLICGVLARRIPHTVFLSGTPSLTSPFDMYLQIDALWPGLLGQTRHHFALHYCQLLFSPHLHIGGVTRTRELSDMLRQAVMIRRLKSEVLPQLPTKQRIVIRLDSVAATYTADEDAAAPMDESADEEEAEQHTKQQRPTQFQTRYSATSKRKLPAVLRFVQDLLVANGLLNEVLAAGGQKARRGRKSKAQHPQHNSTELPRKLVLFAHHLHMLDGLEAHVAKLLNCKQKKEYDNEGNATTRTSTQLSYIRIDGSTIGPTRQRKIDAFSNDTHCSIAIVGVTACAIGVSFAAASECVFCELPPDVSWLQQAEDRLHRLGQRGQHVTVYICLAASDPFDVKHWVRLKQSYTATRQVMDHGGPTTTKDGDGGHTFERQRLLYQVGNTTDIEKEQERTTTMEQQPQQEDRFAAASATLRELLTQVQERLDTLRNLHVTKAESAAATLLLLEPRFVISAHTKRLHFFTSTSSEHDSQQTTHRLGISAALDTVVEASLALEQGTTDDDADDEMAVVQTAGAFVNAYLKKSSYHQRQAVQCMCGRSNSVVGQTAQEQDEEEDGATTKLGTCTINNKAAQMSLGSMRCVPMSLKEMLNLGRHVDDSSRVDRTRTPQPMNRPARYGQRWDPAATQQQQDGDIKHEGVLANGGKKLPQFLMSWAIRWQRGATGGGGRPPSSSGPTGPTYYSATIEALSEGNEDARFRPLCLQCGTPLPTTTARIVPGSVIFVAPEEYHTMFCGGRCMQQYFFQRSGNAVRRQVEAVDRSICSSCGVDCAQLLEKLLAVDTVDARLAIIHDDHPSLEQHPGHLRRLVQAPSAGLLWNADHRIPVFKGGGQSNLDNFQTLCVACHAQKTRFELLSYREKDTNKKMAEDGPPQQHQEEHDCQVASYSSTLVMATEIVSEACRCGEAGGSVPGPGVGPTMAALPRPSPFQRHRKALQAKTN